MAKKIGSVLELTKGLSEDPIFARDLTAYLSERQLVHKLIAVRATQGLTQKDIAERMGCSQGRISKLESSRDVDLSFGAIVGYAQAVGLRLDINLFRQNSRVVDLVKYHALRIKRVMDYLARLAVKDKAIAKGVSDFFGETTCNLLLMLKDSVEKLPPPSEEAAPLVSIEAYDTNDLAKSGVESPPRPGKRNSPAACRQ